MNEQDNNARNGRLKVFFGEKLDATRMAKIEEK